MAVLPDSWRTKTTDIAAICLCVVLFGIMGFARGTSVLLAWLTFHGLQDGAVVEWFVLAQRVSIVMALVGLALLMAVIGVCHGLRLRHRLCGS